MRIAAPSHKASRFEYADVLGDSACRHRERFSEFSNRRVAFQEALKDRPSRWIGERPEYCTELIVCHCGTVRLRNHLVLYELPSAVKDRWLKSLNQTNGLARTTIAKMLCRQEDSDETRVSS